MAIAQWDIVHIIGLPLMVLLIILGLFLAITGRGYRFTGGLCLAGAVIVLCYMLLPFLALISPPAEQIIRITLTGGLVIGAIAAVITGSIIAKISLGKPDAPYAYVVVLGAGVDGTVPSLSMRERLDAVYRYLTAFPDAICIASGGQGKYEHITEAQCIFNELTARGIRPERIWMEERSTSTRENIRFSLDLIEHRTGIRPCQIGLVSSEYHLCRAGLFAREEGVTAYGIPAKTSRLFLFTNYFLREIAAIWYYVIFRRINYARP